MSKIQIIAPFKIVIIRKIKFVGHLPGAYLSYKIPCHNNGASYLANSMMPLHRWLECCMILIAYPDV